jgi:hypothetical protein
MAATVAAGRMESPIAAHHPWELARDASAEPEQRHTLGKIVRVREGHPFARPAGVGRPASAANASSSATRVSVALAGATATGPLADNRAQFPLHSIGRDRSG